jgi:hypothetical protein
MISETDTALHALPDAKVRPDKDIRHVTALMIMKYVTDLALLDFL